MLSLLITSTRDLSYLKRFFTLQMDHRSAKKRLQLILHHLEANWILDCCWTFFFCRRKRVLNFLMKFELWRFVENRKFMVSFSLLSASEFWVGRICKAKTLVWKILWLHCRYFLLNLFPPRPRSHHLQNRLSP